MLTVFFFGAWFTALNIALNVFNKWSFDSLHVRLPMTIVACQQAVTLVVLHAYHVWNRRSCAWPLTKRRAIHIGILALCFAGNTLCNIASVVYISVTMNQCLRAFITVLTMIASVVVEGKHYPTYIWCNGGLLSFGVALSVFKNPSYDALGIALVLVSNVAYAIQGSLSGKLLSQGEPMASWELTMYQSMPIGLVALVMVWARETQAVHDTWTAHPEHVVLVLGSASLMALLYNIVRFQLTKYGSSVFVTVLGNFKGVLLVLLDVWLLGTRMTLLNAVGIVLTFVGFFVHTRYMTRGQKEPAYETLPEKDRDTELT